MKYPISDQLSAAITKLFDPPSTGLGYLGAWEKLSASAGFEESFSPNLDPRERVRILRKRLEGYVALAAAQIEELGSEDETRRLRAESTGTLIALRELWLHFPEAFEP